MKPKKKSDVAVELPSENQLVAALHVTPKVEPDVLPPTGFSELSKGFVYCGWLDSMRVEKACSSMSAHCVGSDQKTTSQRPKALYSSRLLALRAARNVIERECAKILLKLDAEIASELQQKRVL